MDRQLERYQTIAREIVDDYARYEPSRGEIKLQAIADGDCYLLISFGWNGDRRVHSTILHLRVVEGKFWVERDETEEGITQDLLDRGVPKEDIVLAFYHPEDRKLTEFAIA
ncbi:XisI protein [Spirulina sp. CS-785/01]|uniref:XisI protein n=1 Tax=Spirulina sp. CS-785/01 TaxID=3021716 RepID=UPI002330DCB0|nr:XisI protein [Spirulina sp. CS-785/01]MDB9311899.1 XisI protein [Spirulina sp. CS-785/01]